MSRYKITLLINHQKVYVEINSDNEFSALNVVRNTYEYDKILEINEIK